MKSWPALVVALSLFIGGAGVAFGLVGMGVVPIASDDELPTPARRVLPVSTATPEIEPIQPLRRGRDDYEQQPPVIEERERPPICGFGERLDLLSNTCEPAPWSCTDQEEYDFLRERCVPREPNPSDCGFDEEFDFVRQRCVPRGPSPSDCGFGERFDYVREQCEPAPSSCTLNEQYDYTRNRCVPRDY